MCEREREREREREGGGGEIIQRSTTLYGRLDAHLTRYSNVIV